MRPRRSEKENPRSDPCYTKTVGNSLAAQCSQPFSDVAKLLHEHRQSHTCSQLSAREHLTMSVSVLRITIDHQCRRQPNLESNAAVAHLDDTVDISMITPHDRSVTRKVIKWSSVRFSCSPHHTTSMPCSFKLYIIFAEHTCWRHCHTQDYTASAANLTQITTTPV